MAQELIITDVNNKEVGSCVSKPSNKEGNEHMVITLDVETTKEKMNGFLEQLSILCKEKL